MNENGQRDNSEVLKDKLNRALRRLEGLKQKSKLLEMQYEDAKTREQNSVELVGELLERQRELNVMLNRANIMLNRTQEAMALTSMEFNEIAKALPEPKKAEWSERVAKVNELFKKTGIQDAEVLGLECPDAAKFNGDEIAKQSDQAFRQKDSFWNPSVRSEPPRVEAELVEEHEDSNSSEHNHLVDETSPSPGRITPDTDSFSGEAGGQSSPGAQDLEETAETRKMSWWQRTFARSGGED